MQGIVDVLQVAGFVAVGVVVYTLVALVVLAWLGHRYQHVKSARTDAAARAAAGPAGAAVA